MRWRCWLGSNTREFQRFIPRRNSMPWSWSTVFFTRSSRKSGQLTESTTQRLTSLCMQVKSHKNNYTHHFKNPAFMSDWPQTKTSSHWDKGSERNSKRTCRHWLDIAGTWSTAHSTASARFEYVCSTVRRKRSISQKNNWQRGEVRKLSAEMHCASVFQSTFEIVRVMWALNGTKIFSITASWVMSVAESRIRLNQELFAAYILNYEHKPGFQPLAVSNSLCQLQYVLHCSST